ncbi:PREDICTED: uncharacterized protein LOC107186153 [Dufourea novaeangliae]|uniref:Ankyrin-3 n=1 Tax=Dufourea novaeangliae TaxID=178035 RepID=A0A154NXC5_DUFNO|nr:PREDICTED: uncharacterized protein LOC107186153 [Dufourea novaeangliae]KZC04277.1 Ankyrin-3 [Dufourea novaeangliae]
MFGKGNVKLSINSNAKEVLEAEVIKALQKEDYTLNTENSYGENLLHISAANGCFDIIKEILQKESARNVINRKNKFGWTPLMLAVRNRDEKTVKFLLERNANVNDSTYLGLSVFGLAAAIDINMFQIIHKACPSALLNCAHDDITPLCIAAMKNDKNLFFNLLDLGFEVSNINEYTHIMMKLSTVPEIANLAEDLDIESYWNDTSDNISVKSESDTEEELHSLKLKNEVIEKECDKENTSDNIVLSLTPFIKPTLVLHSSETCNDECNNNVIVNSKKCSKTKPSKLNLLNKHLDPIQHSIISPILTCTLDRMLPTSPNIYFTQNKCDKFDVSITNNVREEQLLVELSLQRLQSIRPPDLNIQNDQEDLNVTLTYTPEFSPIRSPYVPSDLNDENVFGENTPTPPHCKTPPRGMILNSEEKKMCILLKRHELSQHIPIFLEQEVDSELFMTLTDQDLIEIGIKEKSERKAILDVIIAYNKVMM